MQNWDRILKIKQVLAFFGISIAVLDLTLSPPITTGSPSTRGTSHMEQTLICFVRLRLNHTTNNIRGKLRKVKTKEEIRFFAIK